MWRVEPGAVPLVVPVVVVVVVVNVFLIFRLYDVWLYDLGLKSSKGFMETESVRVDINLITNYDIQRKTLNMFLD